MTFRDLYGLPSRRQGLLAAVADGYAPDWSVTWGETRSSFHSHWDPVKGADLTLRLVRDVPIHGRIVGPDGRPVAGARVQLSSLDIPDDLDLDAHIERSRNPLSDRHVQSIGRPDAPPA